MIFLRFPHFILAAPLLHLYTTLMRSSNDGRRMERLAELRERRALTLRDLSEMSGVAADTINQIELSHRKARPSTLRKLARALGVAVEEFYTEPARPLAEAPQPKRYFAEVLAGGVVSTGDPLEDTLATRVSKWLREQERSSRLYMPEEDWVWDVWARAAPSMDAFEVSQEEEILDKEFQEYARERIRAELEDDLYEIADPSDADKAQDRTHELRWHVRMDLKDRHARKRVALVKLGQLVLAGAAERIAEQPERIAEQPEQAALDALHKGLRASVP
jgi:transcriptional regulator with XRE-family HTH domain